MKPVSFLFAALFALAGCGAYGRSVVRVAALDHGCDEARVTLLEIHGTTAVLEVCGRRRVYRDTAGATNPATWSDVTLTTEDCGGQGREVEAAEDPDTVPVVEPAPGPEPETPPMEDSSSPNAPPPTP